MSELFHRNPMRAQPTPGCAYVARVPIDHDDRHIAPGDPYPYAEFGKHEFDAFNMWRAGMLAVAPAPSAASSASDLLDLGALNAAQRADLDAATASPRPAKRDDRRARR